MTKNEFLNNLREALKNLKDEEINKSVTYYSEMIDDYIENGDSEEEAVRKMGSIEEITTTIIEDAKETKTTKKESMPMYIIIAVLGFPIWFPILATLTALAVVLYILVWVVIVTICIFEVSIAISAIYSFLGFFGNLTQDIAVSFVMLGASMVFTGVAVLLVKPIIKVIKKLAVASYQFVVKTIKKIKEKIGELK